MSHLVLRQLLLANYQRQGRQWEAMGRFCKHGNQNTYQETSKKSISEQTNYLVNG